MATPAMTPARVPATSTKSKSNRGKSQTQRRHDVWKALDEAVASHTVGHRLQKLMHLRSDRRQRMTLPHAFLRRQVAEHPALPWSKPVMIARSIWGRQSYRKREFFSSQLA